MDGYLVLALIGVLSAFTLLALVIYRWGPGAARRSVDCPVSKVRATVDFLRAEGSFGSLKTVDVAACSLFPGAPVSCDKQCLM